MIVLQKKSVVSFAVSVDDINHTIKELNNNGIEIDNGPIEFPSGETIWKYYLVFVSKIKYSIEVTI